MCKLLRIVVLSWDFLLCVEVLLSVTCGAMNESVTGGPHTTPFDGERYSLLLVERYSLLQLLLLWYPYLTPKECQELAEAAPSSHEKPPQRIDEDHTWGAADIAVMQREFAALDTSGDGFVDRHVRPPSSLCSPAPGHKRTPLCIYAPCTDIPLYYHRWHCFLPPCVINGLAFPAYSYSARL